MESNAFNKICAALTNLINKLDVNYSIIQLKGERAGMPIRSVIVEVCGQNYLQVDSANYISFFELFPRTKYQKPVYHCSPDKNGQYTLFKEGKEIICISNFSVDALIKETFGELTNKYQNRQEVAELLGNLMNQFILPDKLGYDINNQTFYFLDWNNTYGIEYLWFSNYFRNLKKSVQKPSPYDGWHVAKYTTLDTALKILNSGKMRMLSVTAMNDKLEIGHLYGDFCCNDFAILENKTRIHAARHRYITSFTDKIDDLTMWRLYGDNGKGVCLVFSEPNECPYYLPVDYLGKESEICRNVKRICSDLLNKHGIRFTFKSLEYVWQYFLKPEGFCDEQELRYLRIDNSKPDGYLLATNDVISSYKDFSLTDDKEKPESVFPASLQGVILGPNIKNVEINRLQLEELAIEKGLYLLKGVQKSSINYYL